MSGDRFDGPLVSWSQLTWISGVMVRLLWWLFSYSIGVSMSSAVWRLWRLWKISRYSKIALASSMRVRQRRRSSSSTCMRAQNDSIKALSKQSPTVPMDGTSPESWARWVNAQEANWVPWSECITVPGWGWRFPIAIPNAEVTSPGGCCVVDRPAHHSATEHIQHDSTVNLAFPGGMFRDVGHPKLVRFDTDQVAVNQVRWGVHGAGAPSGTSVTC